MLSVILRKLHICEIWSFSYGPKYSQPIRFQYCLIMNISGRNQSISSFFCLELVIKGRQHLGVPFLVGFGQLCLFSSQISGILDHQSIPLDRTIWNLSFFACRWSSKEINMLSPLLGVAKCAYCPIRLQDSLIINISWSN